MLEWLLNHGTAEAEPYLEQLPLVSVISNCGCGCPTIVLAVGDRAADVKSPSTILADGEGISPEGVHVGIIVHGREELISEREFYPLSEYVGTISLPQISDLKGFGAH
jgi:hypothetical protein